MVVGTGEATCMGCGYEYQPKNGDPEYPITPGTYFTVSGPAILQPDFTLWSMPFKLEPLRQYLHLTLLCSALLISSSRLMLSEVAPCKASNLAHSTNSALRRVSQRTGIVRFVELTRVNSNRRQRRLQGLQRTRSMDLAQIHSLVGRRAC